MRRFSGDKPEKKRTSGKSVVGKPERSKPDWKEKASGENKPWKNRENKDQKPWNNRSDRENRPWEKREEKDPKPWSSKSDRSERPWKKEERDQKPWNDKKNTSERPWKKNDDNRERKPWSDRSDRNARPWKKEEDKERSPWKDKSREERPWKKNDEREQKPQSDRSERGSTSWRNKSETSDKTLREKSESDKRSEKRSDDRIDKPWQKREVAEKRPWKERSERGEDNWRKREGSETKPWKERNDRENSAWPKKERKGSRSATSGSDDGLTRLNKYIANSGVCSRREADEMIAAGAIKVNGQIVTELGTKVGPEDKVQIGDETLNPQKKVYLLLNKPKGYITTVDDPQERNTVMMLVKDACKERIYPVGRLDRNTSGLLLMTNDGEIAKKLTHPSHRVRKIYQVELNKAFAKSDMIRMTEGIELEDGIMSVDEIAYTGSGDDKKSLGVVIHSGKNRIVRRMFEALDYEVTKLDRVAFANLTKKDLPRGRWRFLQEGEVNMLKMI